MRRHTRSKTARAVGTGFYIALAICVLAVGGMAVTTFTDTMRTAEEHTAFTTAPPTTATSVSPVAGSPATETSFTNATTTVTVPSLTTTTVPRPTIVWPMGQTVTAPFSETPVYSETMEDYRVHLGVDFAGEDGADVCAAAEGTVREIGEDALWGGSITIEHDGGLCTVYRGVDAAVNEGDEVVAGEAIGSLSGVPCERGDAPHLHMELLRNGTAVDPIEWLEQKAP